MLRQQSLMVYEKVDIVKSRRMKSRGSKVEFNAEGSLEPSTIHRGQDLLNELYKEVLEGSGAVTPSS